MRDFTQYVHEFVHPRHGTVGYAVAKWDPDRGQYVRPLDKTEAELTGCSAEFARQPWGVQYYTDRKRALRRARYLFYEIDQKYHDFLQEGVK